MQAANVRDFLGGGFDGFAQAVDIDQQHRRGADRVARVHVFFDGANRPAIEHFAGCGRDAAAGDFGDGFGGVVHFVVHGEQRFHRFRECA